MAAAPYIAPYSGLDRLWSLQQLNAAGYGTRERLTLYIQEGRLRARKIGGMWKVSESDLQAFLAAEHGTRTSSDDSVLTPVAELGDLISLVVEAYPRMTGVERRGVQSELKGIASRDRVASDTQS